MPKEEVKEGSGEKKPEEKPEVKPVPTDVEKLQKDNKGLIDKAKVLEDKLKKSEAEKVRLVGTQRPIIPPVGQSVREKYANRFPQTEEEWSEVADEDPVLAMDLRIEYKNSQQSSIDKLRNSAKKVQDKHSDMYEKDASGNFVQITFPDGSTGPKIDENSPKGKVWMKLAGRDPRILEIENGPEIVMKAMEAELRGEEEAKVKEELEKKGKEAEEKRQKDVDAGAVASGGSTPPAPPKKELKFNSEEEKASAEKAVASGKFKSLEEYCEVRDNQDIPYGRGGF